MVYFVNRQFDSRAKVSAVLLKTFGINQTHVSFLLKKFGIPFQIRLEGLTGSKRSLLSQYVQSHFVIEKKLTKFRNEILGEQLRGGRYRGLRMRQGLPVRGQRTHTNGSTARRMQVFWQSLLKKK